MARTSGDDDDHNCDFYVAFATPQSIIATANILEFTPITLDLA